MPTGQYVAPLRAEHGAVYRADVPAQDGHWLCVAFQGTGESHDSSLLTRTHVALTTS